MASDEVYASLLADFDEARRQEVSEYVRVVSNCHQRDAICSMQRPAIPITHATDVW
jgi:hypothetical protein